MLHLTHLTHFFLTIFLIGLSLSCGKTTDSGTTGCTASPDPTQANGHGSAEDNPIVICDYAGLKAMATHGLDKHYALGTHINAKGSWAEGETNCTAYDGIIVPSTGTPCNGWGLGNLTGSLDGEGFKYESSIGVRRQVIKTRPF